MRDYYDQVLSEIDEPESVNLKSHNCEMHLIPPTCGGWFCDKINGVDRCISGMTNDYSQGKCKDPYMYGWRCQSCNYYVCVRCMKADRFISILK